MSVKDTSIGAWFVSTYRKLTRLLFFKSSGTYWEERYKKGGNSGAGSYNELAEFKAEIINNFVQENNVKSVMEFGCGDGNQIKYFQFEQYTGYDISETVVNICRNLYKNDASKTFKLVGEHKTRTADLTMSLDVIYHLIEDDTYHNYMEKLFTTADKYVIIYSSNSNVNHHSAAHVRHREFTTWVQEHAKNFNLIKQIPNKYNYNREDKANTSFADFYIFEKI